VAAWRSRASAAAAFAAGALAALTAISVSELLAGLLAGAPSLVTVVGDLVIDLQPPGAKDLVVSLFGENDKAALLIGILIAALLIGGILGVAARPRFGVAVAGFGAAGLAGLVAALAQPLTDPLLAVVTSVLAVGAGLLVLRLLLGAAEPRPAAAGPLASPGPGEGLVLAPGTPTGPPAVSGDGRAVAAMPDWDRRRFLLLGGGVVAGSLAAGLVGRSLLERRPAGAPPVAALPQPEVTVPAAPELASFDVPGLTPIVVPNDRFYRIDTALVSPRVDAGSWTLTVKGMVEQEVTLGYEDLAAMPLIEQYVTIACVSNEVGGNLVGNALWTGVDLRSVLDMAGVAPEATQIVGRSVDGFTAGFPTAWAMDASRQPMIALGMNGEPLPVDHGYPARLIIPGLYGYVSATKWLKEIELTTWEAFDGYWVPLGWAKEAPILTQSRIDVPQRGATVQPGTVAIAGVAWAPDRGISRVEVRIDDGPWQPAEITQPLADAAWVQWKLAWAADPGSHRITVRATDGTGEAQTDEQTRPAPDGARGHHSIEVRVA
jgi:DMSO/TMAO reductase YedYZ molybdopterin-dependent catalytic subunit